MKKGSTRRTGDEATEPSASRKTLKVLSVKKKSFSLGQTILRESPTFQALFGDLAEPYCFLSNQGLSLRGSAKDQKLSNLLSSKFLPQILSGRKTINKAKKEKEKGNRIFLDSGAYFWEN